MVTVAREGADDAHRSLAGLLKVNLLASAVIFALLELWRPCFFLTDDSFGCFFPFFTEVGHHLWHGQSPFVSDYLFGGNYNLLNDPNFFLWHPVYLLTSLLANTPAHFWIIDADAFFLLMVATAGFVCLADFLRREERIALSDGWLTFFTLSFTYSFMALATGASWFNYLGNYSALPWLTLGILQREFRRGVVIVALFALHEILGGHLAPLVSGTLFLSLFALGVAYGRRSAVPIASWALGNAVAILLVLPLLLPMIHGFLGSARAGGIGVGEMDVARVPAVYFFGSYFLGTSFWMVKHPGDFHVYHPVLVASAAGWYLVLVLASRSRWKFLEILCAALLVLCALVVVRPTVVSEVMIHLPILRSMREPFRELLIFEFLLHLLFVLRVPAFSARLRTSVAAAGCLAFLIPLLLYAPPSFNPDVQQRRLVFSGDADRWWAEVKKHLQPGDRVAAVVPLDSYMYYGEWAPFVLLGTHNFPALYQVTSASGYSPTAPRDQLYLPLWHELFGFYYTNQIDELWRERPGLKLLVMESTQPLRITLRSKDGTVVDLTPYIPPYVTASKGK